LPKLPGIGRDLSEKIQEILLTGKLSYLEDLRNEMPSGLLELLHVPGLGPKRVKVLHDRLKISSLKSLENAARTGEIQKIIGFGKKIEARILEELERHRYVENRIKLATAEEVALPLLTYLKNSKGVKQVIVAGSFRR
jgi:DNA polymerase (family 10)